MHELCQSACGLKKRIKEIFFSHARKENSREAIENTESFISHFTTLDGFMKICKSSLCKSKKKMPEGLRLFLSDTTYLNDPFEGDALYEYLDSVPDRSAEHQRERNSIREEFSPLEFHQKQDSYSLNRSEADEILDFLERLGVKGTAAKSNGNTAINERIFVCSFTSRDDYLDLWRAYGNDGNGVCLSMKAGESIKRLENYGEPPRNPDYQLYRVAYDNAEKARTWLQLLPRIREIVRLVKDDQGLDWSNVQAEILSDLTMLSHLYKHEQYSSEGEVRLIRKAHIADSNVLFKSKNKKTPEHLHVDVTGNRVFSYSPPFFFGNSVNSRLIIGPKVPDGKRLRVTLSAYLKTLWPKKTPRVELSTVPYQ